MKMKRRSVSNVLNIFYRLLGAGMTLCLLIISSDCFAAEGTWQLVFHPAASIQGENVLLEEVAEPTAKMAPEQWQKLRTTTLWKAPRESQGVVYLSRIQLKRLIQARLGGFARVSLIPYRMALKRKGKVLLEDDLTKRLVTKLTPKLGYLEAEIQVREYSLPSFLFLESASDTLAIEGLSRVVPGRNSVKFSIKDSHGNIRKRVTGSFFVDAWKALPCAAKPLNRREILTPDLVTFKRKNLAYLRSDVWDGKGGSWMMKKPVGTGQVIYASSITPLPMIRRGEQVDLVFQGKHIRLSVPARALEDGGAREIITVINLQSKQEVTARVMDSRTVMVQ